MPELKYKVINNETQYKEFTRILEDLVFSDGKRPGILDEIDLLTFLIKKWDAEHNTFEEVDPIRLLHSFIADPRLRSKDLAGILGISKGYLSEILHYKKRLPKDVFRKLASHFKISQDAFNRPYKLIVPSL